MLFERISDLRYRDYQGKFVIYFKQERKGRICEFFDRGAPDTTAVFRFAFPQDVAGVPRELEVRSLSEIDGPLMALFRARVEVLAPASG